MVMVRSTTAGDRFTERAYRRPGPAATTFARPSTSGSSDRMRPMPASTQRWPTAIADDTALDELLSAPSPAAIDVMGQLEGDLIVLGVAGKMGPTLARMARRASDAAG